MSNLVCLIFLCCFLFGFVVGFSKDDTECLNNAKELSKCMSKNSTVDEKVASIEDRILKCFKDNKCAVPDLDADIFSKINITGPLKDLVASYRRKWEDTPEVVKVCMYTSLRAVAFSRINRCLKQKKVDPIDVDQNQFFDIILPLKGPGENRSDESNAMLKGIFNVLLGWKRCKNENGAKAYNATVQCSGEVIADTKSEFCVQSKICRKDKVTTDCQKREKQISSALCSCVSDKLKDVKDMLKKLPKDKELFFGEFKEAVLNSDFEKDRQESEKVIQKCFTDNKVENPGEPEYDAISWGMALSGHDARGPLELLPIIFFQVALENNENPFYLKIKSDQVEFVHDILHQMIKGQDCGCN